MQWMPMQKGGATWPMKFGKWNMSMKRSGRELHVQQAPRSEIGNIKHRSFWANLKAIICIKRAKKITALSNFV